MNYRKNRRIILLAIVIAFVGFVFFEYFTPSANKAKQNVINSKKVKLGMTKLEVYKIMGEPDAKQISFFNTRDTMYYYKPPFAASEGIYIQVGDSSGKVNKIILFE